MSWASILVIPHEDLFDWAALFSIAVDSPDSINRPNVEWRLRKVVLEKLTLVLFLSLGLV